MTEKKCLLIIPNGFYSFHKLIAEALEKKGYTVSIANDEYPIGFVGKIIGKLQLPIVFPITSSHINKHFLSGKKYQLALIFKGRGMSNQLIDKIKEHADIVIGYNWDSFKYNEGPLKWYKSVNKYYTFDFEDSDRYLLPAVELFSSLSPVEGAKEIKYDMSALFRNHSERLKYLDKILSNIKTSSLFIYIYEQNIFTLIPNFIKNPFLYLKYWKYIHFKPLKYANYLDALKYSEFTIDYAHTDQSGITMRCYESINLNTKVITNNDFIKRSKFFNESNSVIFPLDHTADELTQRYEACKSKDFIANYRNISHFIDDLILDVNKN